MEITRDNYEAFFIDYLEGNLDEKMIDQFIEFLQANPDLKAELETFRAVSTEEEVVTFPGKEKLYREKYDSQKVFDQTSVAILENDSSEEETLDFNSYLEKHPGRIKEFDLFQKTRLQSDESLVFENKDRLYRVSRTRQLFLLAGRGAAILVLIFSATILLKHYSEVVPQKQLAKISVKGTEIHETKVPAIINKQVKKKAESIPVAKDSVKTGTDKSIREKTHGRVEEAVAGYLKESEPLSPIAALCFTFPVKGENVELVSINSIQQAGIPGENLSDEKLLLAEVVKQKTKLRGLSLSQIARAGLTFFSDITKNKFSYKTNKKGDITELELDTRLLAFTIPTKERAE